MLVECMVMGIFSIFINFFGFGCFMEEYIVDFLVYGIYIFDWWFCSLDDFCLQFIFFFYSFCQQSWWQCIIQWNCMECFFDFLDWKYLGWYYMFVCYMVLFKVFLEYFIYEFSEVDVV